MYIVGIALSTVYLPCIYRESTVNLPYMYRSCRRKVGGRLAGGGVPLRVEQTARQPISDSRVACRLFQVYGLFCRLISLYFADI